jgi:hypothetical protein
MKYGEQLEQESVPQWSLHNLDYNSLKHEIKTHTTRNQATAIAIPGQQDHALRKFEDGLYLELCRQHDRVSLFVNSKADEISRRLGHLQSRINRWLGKQEEHPSISQSLRQQRRFAKYERELSQCGDDIHALSRFANAQIVAFRKIIKKYKKWTGSTALGARFNENVLSSPKSFTRRDYSALRVRYEDILQGLRASSPQFDDPSSPSTDGQPSSSSRPCSSRRIDFEPLPLPAHDDYHRSQQNSQPTIKYWNEYDDGSDAGGPEDDYAIYIDPDESTFPGLGYVQAILSLPLEKAKSWFRARRSSDREPLLDPSRPPTRGYFSTATANTESDEEGYASSSDFPSHGFAAHYAFPSINDQKVHRYRESVLLWTTVGCFFMSFALLAISSVLITAGRHKLRVEVDAAVTIGVAMSLLCACSGIGSALYRKSTWSLMHQVVIGSAFIATCLLNGMLLILVVDNAP